MVSRMSLTTFKPVQLPDKAQLEMKCYSLNKRIYFQTVFFCLVYLPLFVAINDDSSPSRGMINHLCAIVITTMLSDCPAVKGTRSQTNSSTGPLRFHREPFSRTAFSLSLILLNRVPFSYSDKRNEFLILLQYDPT